MKKLIALMLTLVLALSLTGCFGMGQQTSSTADQAVAADVETYDKDFDGLVKYITDRNNKSVKSTIFYDILGAQNGARIVLNSNAYVEVYDFSNVGSATADQSAESAEKARIILEDIKASAEESKDGFGKFSPMENSIEMTAVITDSGKYVLAWDATRSYDYPKNVATDELKENW